MRIRSGYSFRQAAGSIEDVMARLKVVGYSAAPLADRASTFGFARWKKLADKANLRPIYGVELAVTPSIHAKRPVVDYWTFYARDNLSSITRLVELATEQFHYEPLLTYEQANAASGVLKIIGRRSVLSEVVNDGQTFVALGPDVSRGYIGEAIERGFPLIASSDNKYPTEDQLALYEIICGNQMQTYPQHILDWEEWREAVKDKASPEQIDMALSNLECALQEDQDWAKLTASTLLTPKKPKTLRQMCMEGAVKIGCDLSDPVYSARMDRELELIAAKNFEDYFYIIADLVQWARSEMIVGPARGSSCGSLVCYLLEITTIDPIPYGLIFERFIDINRNDLPDIDIDFSDQKRYMVYDYLAQKYGSSHVAKLGTVAMYQPRSAVSEAGAALGVPKWKCEAALDSLIERSSGDSRALNTLEDTFNTTPAGKSLLADWPEIMIAAKMEGHPRHSSSHAAGIIITARPISEYVAIDRRTGAIQCDKKDAEEFNFLKIDALGLTQLSVFEDALELAGLDRNALESIPLDDPAALDVINKAQFSGIFQFNGLALQSLARSVVCDRLDDLVSITALARPGPLASGGATEWTKRKRGDSPISYPHEVFRPYLEDTKGIILYQEQVMEIGRKIGDLSWEDVTSLRKAMSKSLGKEFFDQYGDRFKAGAIAKGIPAEMTTKIWDEMCAYGSWAFNKSHSVAYGVVSYQCCWLKAHYPLEFAAATLSHEDDPAKQIQMLRELDAEGITYLAVDAELSTGKWSVGLKDGKRRLIGPVQNVKGIGPKLMQQIVSARARGEPLPARANKLLSDAVTPLDSLWPIRDAFNRVMPDPADKNIFTPPMSIGTIEFKGYEYPALVFCIMEKIDPRDENDNQNVAKRDGRRLKGPTMTLRMFIQDDTGTMFAKIDRYDYEALGKEIAERGGVGKCLYALKGVVPKDFRMLKVKQARFIGMLDKKAQLILEASKNDKSETV